MMALTWFYSWGTYSWSCLQCVIADAVVFYCVDKVCKSLLENCRDVGEKKTVWLYESMVLFVLATALYFSHHQPLLLWMLASMTLISATSTGRIDLLYYWETLNTYWREFKDQEEQAEPYAPPPQPLYKNQVSDEQCREYMRETNVIINNQNSTNMSAIGEGLKSLKYNEKTAAFEFVGNRPQISRAPDQSAQQTQPGLRRRALHSRLDASGLVTSVSEPVGVRHATSTVLESIENLGTKVWNVFNLRSQSNAKSLPHGLSNSGSNLCFLNSVLQCIARAPNLADELAEDVKSCHSKDEVRILLFEAAIVVMQKLNGTRGDDSLALVDTVDLIEAGAQVNPDLLRAEKSSQAQQDACEFLTWLLYEIHETINESNSSNTGMKSKVYKDDSMSPLKSVYGNISESHIKLMKRACVDQIAHVKGLSDPNLAEPIQNLANMEWISHKRSNISVVDTLFTFQCIELQTCSQCLSSMASVQSMSILPLPVNDQVEMTTINECLKIFTAEERLCGRDGLQCDNCQKVIKNIVLDTPGITTRSSSKRMSVNGAPLSPIQSDVRPMSSVGPNSFLASTPLPESGSKSAPSLLKATTAKVVTECVRRCFLRRLPECLTIQLLRFNYNPFTKKVVKVHTPLTVVVENLDLTEFTFDSYVEREDMTGISKQNQYTLYGLCLHIGGNNTNSGHYLSICKAADGLWYKFDDENVYLIQNIETELNKTVVRENCYLLFYKKQHDEPNASSE